MSTRYFVTTGPESSGKTTLAVQLADYFRAPLVPEISREYLNEKFSADPLYQYSRQDLLEIARKQHSQEQTLAAYDPALIVCDTDLLVLEIWHEFKYGTNAPWITETLAAVNSGTDQRHYFLCDWNIPWQEDPLRENPCDRDQLFRLYQERLELYNLPYTLVSGSHQERLQAAINTSSTRASV